MPGPGPWCLIEAVALRLIEHAEELTDLDRAIGDGDHGLNMKRGAEAVLAKADALAALPLAELLRQSGMTLVMTVGGASGPLYGTLLLELGKALQGQPEPPDRASLAAALGQGVAAVKARGRSDGGQKTLLDVLIPLQQALASPQPVSGLGPLALAAAEATTPMLATRGRASFLGERSIGHMDPGARSSALMLVALLEALTAAPAAPQLTP
ncbi:MAG: dihydroxyacetone kinase subunit DhaL [Synechococcaceae cyanobacterium ELA739]|jgi:dihydroxyacetone kinase-like protein